MLYKRQTATFFVTVFSIIGKIHKSPAKQFIEILIRYL